MTVTVTGGVTEPPVLAVVPGEPALLRFTAAAGASYTVRAQESLGGDWSKVLDVPAAPAARIIETPLTGAGEARFFQVITPALP